MHGVIDTLHFTIEYFDGQDDDDVGYPYYVATATEISAVTDATTLDDLIANIRELVALYLDEPDPIAEYNIIANPRIVITLDLSYAQTA